MYLRVSEFTWLLDRFSLLLGERDGRGERGGQEYERDERGLRKRLGIHVRNAVRLTINADPSHSVFPRVLYAENRTKVFALSLPPPRSPSSLNSLSPPSHRDGGTKSITPMNAAGTTHRGRNAMEPRNPV